MADEEHPDIEDFGDITPGLKKYAEVEFMGVSHVGDELMRQGNKYLDARFVVTDYAEWITDELRRKYSILTNEQRKR